MNKIDKAYLAGFLDADGCIAILKYQGPRNRTPNYTLRVIFLQHDREFLEDIKALVGLPGHINKAGEQLIFSSNYAAAILKDLQPYCRRKLDQVDLAIAFSHIKSPSLGRGKTTPPAIVKMREKLYQDLKSLHINRVPREKAFERWESTSTSGVI